MNGDIPLPLRPGDELTSIWLNKLLRLAQSGQIRLGVNCGLSVVPTSDGFALRLSNPNVRAQLAITNGTITARVGTTAGTGSVYLVGVSVVSGTCTLTTSAVTLTVYNLSATTGGILTGKYCWVEQHTNGFWFITTAEC